MDKLTEMQVKMKDVPCPRCFHSRLHVSIRPANSGDPAHYVAECGSCHFTFEVDDKRPFWRDIEAKARRKAKKQGCNKCGSNQLELSFRCWVETKQCLHIATCRECGFVFIVEEIHPSEPKPPILDR